MTPQPGECEDSMDGLIDGWMDVCMHAWVDDVASSDCLAIIRCRVVRFGIHLSNTLSLYRSQSLDWFN
jgi:hypothetical protein